VKANPDHKRSSRTPKFKRPGAEPAAPAVSAGTDDEPDADDDDEFSVEEDA
jgi:hypothetical protein